MRNILTTVMSAVLVLAGASSAFAGTEVFNSYKTTNEYGGRHTQIDVEQFNLDISKINSQSVKFEADKGLVNTANVKFNGDSFTGNATSVGGEGSVAIGTAVEENTFSVSKENVNISTTEKVKFNSSDYTHTVGNSY